jgi:hypothetical protein
LGDFLGPARCQVHVVVVGLGAPLDEVVNFLLPVALLLTHKNGPLRFDSRFQSPRMRCPAIRSISAASILPFSPSLDVMKNPAGPPPYAHPTLMRSPQPLGPAAPIGLRSRPCSRLRQDVHDDQATGTRCTFVIPVHQNNLHHAILLKEPSAAADLLFGTKEE